MVIKVKKVVVEKIEKKLSKDKSDEQLDETEKKSDFFKRGDKKFDLRDREKTREEEAKERSLANWVPKTELGREVNTGKITNISEIFKANRKIMEAEIVDKLLDVPSELLDIGQAKGKFGGGQRRAWRQTQRKTKEGNVITSSVMAVVGDRNGHIGLGTGRAKETLPAKEKAIRKAKLSIRKIHRGCGSYDCSCDEPHSIPYKVVGKCSGVTVKLLPAPQGTGLVAGDQLKKILKLAGIKDVYTKTFGPTKTTINAAKACMNALDKLGGMEL